MVQSALENSPETQPGETGVYRRADVEGFAEWARTTIDRLEREVAGLRNRLAGAEQRAADAEKALASRDALESVLRTAADQAAAAAADAAAGAAAVAATERVEALLEDARARANARAKEQGTVAEPAWEPRPESVAHQPPQESSVSFDDPVRDPLPPWDERLLAFPDEPSELPPIGPIFERDTHRTA